MNESLRKYLLYDSRAIFDSNEGSILYVCNSDKEARREAKALDLGKWHSLLVENGSALTWILQKQRGG